MKNVEKIRHIFFNTSGIATLWLVFMHQGIIASSVFFLTRAISEFQNNGEYMGYVFLYFLSMTTPYIPGYLSYIHLQKWVNKSHKKYIEYVVKKYKGKTGIYKNLDARLFIESAVARSSFSNIREFLSFLHGFAGFFLNGFLSLAVVGVVLPGNIFLGYLIGAALCFSMIIVTRRAIGELACRAENSFVSYTAVLNNIWPNITIGNKLNHDFWVDIFSSESEKYYRAKLQFEGKRQAANIMLSFFSLVPTIFLVYAALIHEKNSAIVAAIIVNLTRIFHILGSLNSLVSDSLDWSSMYSKIKILFYDIKDESKNPGYIDCGKIKINGDPILSANEFSIGVKFLRVGRFTVRGGNGSGKSTLLLMLKDVMGDAAFYMPPSLDGLIWRREFHGKKSTGQKMLEALDCILGNDEVSHILLDEWDANLDKNNTEAIDRLIDSLSRKKVVIEVRH